LYCHWLFLLACRQCASPDTWDCSLPHA